MKKIVLSLLVIVLSWSITARAYGDRSTAITHMVIDNNDYYVELMLNGRPYEGKVSFLSGGDGQLIDITPIDAVASDDNYIWPSNFEWSVNRDYVACAEVRYSRGWGASTTINLELGHVFYTTLAVIIENQREEYVLVGTIDGDYDIDIEGFIFRNQDWKRLVEDRVMNIGNDIGGASSSEKVIISDDLLPSVRKLAENLNIRDMIPLRRQGGGWQQTWIERSVGHFHFDD